MLDRYFHCLDKGQSPEAPVQMLEQSYLNEFLGGAANTAANAAAVGSRVDLITCLGSDAEAEAFLKLVANYKLLNISPVIAYDYKTTVKDRYLVGASEQRLRVDRDMGTSLPEYVNSSLFSKVINYDITDAIILSDYNKGVVSERIVKAINAQRAELNSFLVVLDPKPEHEDFYKKLDFDVMTPNLKEAEELWGKDYLCTSVLAANLSRKFDCSVVITLSGDGFCMKGRGSGAGAYRPAVIKNAIDVTGAGDTFTAVLTLGLCSGLTLLEACEVANIASGMVVLEVGTAVLAKDALVKEVVEYLKMVTGETV